MNNILYQDTILNKKYAYIYMITNLIDAKQYIGQHITNNLKDGYFGSGQYLLKAIKKYGKENFNKEILCFCKTIEELNLMEDRYIVWFETMVPRGYNLQSGGRSNWNISEETRLKQSLAKTGRPALNKGTKATTETRLKQSLARKGKTPWNKDQTYSHEYRQKLSEAHKGKALTDEHKQNITKGLNRIIICLETQQIFDSSLEASKELNISVNSICSQIMGKILSCAGKWHFEIYNKNIVYTPDYCKQQINDIESKRHRPADSKISLYCVELDKTFLSIREAIDYFDVDRGTINRCLKNEKMLSCKQGKFTLQYK